jgi:hypothetical protein
MIRHASARQPLAAPAVASARRVSWRRPKRGDPEQRAYGVATTTTALHDAGPLSRVWESIADPTQPPLALGELPASHALGPADLACALGRRWRHKQPGFWDRRPGHTRRARRGRFPPPRQPLRLPALRRRSLRTLQTCLHRHVSTRQRRRLPLLRLHRPPEVRPQSLPR